MSALLPRVWIGGLLLLACGASTTPAKGPLAANARASAADAPRAERAGEGGEEHLAVPIESDDAVRGDREAYVTIVVFSDFECPACARARVDLDAIWQAHGAANVRLVYKHYPLRQHPHARLAAEVGQGVLATSGVAAFWRYHDAVFSYQDLLDKERILACASRAGADERAILQGLEASTWAREVDRDRATGDRIGLLGTPSIFVNGVALDRVEASLDELVADQLERGRALAARGVARSAIYAELVASNFTPRSEEREPSEETVSSTVWRVPVGKSPVRGKADALVTIVEFSDFECPFCKRVQPTLEKLRTEYGEDVRFVWKDMPLPFHSRAIPAAVFARSMRAGKAGDAAFWDVHDALFASAPDLDDTVFDGIAKRRAEPSGQATARSRGKAHERALEDDLVLADDVAATSTPHFFINGRRLAGAQPYEAFKVVVDEELEKARASIARGQRRATLYEDLVKRGEHAPPPERKTVPLPGSLPFRGAADGKIVIQQFSDFECHWCKKAEATLDELLAAYPGRIKIVFRNLPLVFHAHAELAAEAAREAFVQRSNAGFSKMRAKLFEHQADAGGLERPALDSYAREIGLDVARFGKALDEHTHRAAIEAEKRAAEDAGIRSTPVFLVGPFVVSGAQPYRHFKRVVDLAANVEAP